MAPSSAAEEGAEPALAAADPKASADAKTGGPGGQAIPEPPANSGQGATPSKAGAQKSKADIEDVLFKELPGPPPPVVSSATKIEQPIFQAPSAITVITAEDIRRMGARRLVDVFRWTPGLDVFTPTGNSAAVSARGVYSLRLDTINEMLVLIDGRSVYVDFNGRVDWDTLPILLEEIERIEIILGPSGSLYGPNAFAGTISIFTKQKPEPGISHTSVGNKHLFESNTVNWITGENYTIRLGLGWQENEGFGRGSGRDFRDDINFLRMNMFSQFRLDENDNLEIRGGWLTGYRGFPEDGFFEQGRQDIDVPYGQVNFEHRFSEDARFNAQYFHNAYNDAGRFGNGTRGLETWTDVITLEQFWRVHPRHQLIFGGELRNFVAHSGLIDPERIEENFRSLFVEDSITLVEKKLNCILGVRYDDFTVSGDDFSPRAALVWTPVPQHAFRASLSRSVATPPSTSSFFDYLSPPVATVNVGPPFGQVPILVQLLGNPHLNPESILAYEIGYRGRWSEKLDVRLDLFLYDIADLIRPFDPVSIFDPTIPAIVVPTNYLNLVDSLAYGGELSVNYRWTKWLGTFFGYSYKEIPEVTAGDDAHEGIENSKNSIFGGLDYRFWDTWMLSARMAWRDRFALIQNQFIEDHLRLDLRLAKSFCDGRGTIELIGQNLVDAPNLEGDAGVGVPTTVFLGFEYRY